MKFFACLLASLLLLSPLSLPTSAWATPCETYEPNCDGSDDTRNDDDNADPQRPGDPNGPDDTGSDDEI
jgi:hypothetical protein